MHSILPTELRRLMNLIPTKALPWAFSVLGAHSWRRASALVAMTAVLGTSNLTAAPPARLAPSRLRLPNANPLAEPEWLALPGLGMTTAPASSAAESKLQLTQPEALEREWAQPEPMSSLEPMAPAALLTGPIATITTAATAATGAQYLPASVPSQSGCTYAWTATGATIAPGYASQNAIAYTVTAASGGTVSLQCIVTNASNQSTTGSATVSVAAAPSITSFTAASTTLLQGQSTTLTATFTGGTATVDSGVGAVTSGTAVSVSPSVTTTYTLKVAAPGLPAQAATVTITVTPISVDITAAPILTTGTGPFTASVPYVSTSTYLWTITGGAITGGGTSYAPSYTPGAVGTLTLTCKVTNSAGTSLTGFRTIPIIAAPVITSFTAGTPNIVQGGSSTLTPVFSGGQGFIDHGVGAVTSGQVVTVTANQSTSYTLTVTNAAGTNKTAPASLTVQPPPNATITVQSKVTAGKVFLAWVPAASGSTYLWTVSGGTAYNGQGTSSFQFTAGASGTVNLTCTINNSAGMAGGGSATAQIVPAPVISSFTIGAGTVPPGGSTTLTAVFSGGTGVINNGVGPVTSGQPVTITPGQSTGYILTVTNGAATAVTSSVSVAVQSLSSAQVSLPGIVTAGVAGTYHAYVPSTSGATYAWTISGGSITSSAGTSNVTFTPTTAGTPAILTCAVTSGGTTTTGSATAQVVAPPSIASFTAAAASIALGNTTTLTGTFSNGSGSINQGVGPVVSGTATTVQPAAGSTLYTLTVTNTAGSTTTASFTVNAVDTPRFNVTMPAYVTTGVSYQASVPSYSGASYGWSILGGTFSGNPGSTAIFVPGPAGTPITLTCEVMTSAGVNGANSVTAQILPAPAITSFTANATTLPPGGPVTMSSVFSNGTGVISPGVGPVTSGTTVTANPASTNSYLLTVTNLANTAATAGVSFTRVPLALVLTPVSTNLPSNYSQLFLARTNLGQDEPVTWSVLESFGGSISGAGVYSAPAQAGTYHVQAVSTAHPWLSAQATVMVPLQVAITPEAGAVAAGQSQTFSAAVTGSTDTRVLWSVWEAGGGTVTPSGVYTAPSTPGVYHLVAASMADPTKTAQALVTVGAGGVTVSVSPNTVSLAKNTSQVFTATVEGGTQGVTWSASAGTITTGGLYTAPGTYGTYTIKATSKDDTHVVAEATVVISGGSASGAFTYDLNGNLTGDGDRTFEWDAEDRLVAVTLTATGHRSEFSYDGMGRRIEIVEKDNSVVSSDTKYLWEGSEIAEARNAAGNGVLKRFYGQGFVDTDGTNLFYMRDHLGSVRELTDGSQAIRARYDYDPYGRMTKISGDRDSVFGYAGMLWHQQSGLNLTLLRAYDPKFATWISRDSLPESVIIGIGMPGTKYFPSWALGLDLVNRYCYVEDNPINMRDPDGREPVTIVSLLILAYLAAQATVTAYSLIMCFYYGPCSDANNQCESGRNPQKAGLASIQCLTCIASALFVPWWWTLITGF